MTDDAFYFPRALFCGQERFEESVPGVLNAVRSFGGSHGLLFFLVVCSCAHILTHSCLLAFSGLRAQRATHMRDMHVCILTYIHTDRSRLCTAEREKEREELRDWEKCWFFMFVCFMFHVSFPAVRYRGGCPPLETKSGKKGGRSCSAQRAAVKRKKRERKRGEERKETPSTPFPPPYQSGNRADRPIRSHTIASIHPSIRPVPCISIV